MRRAGALENDMLTGDQILKSLQREQLSFSDLARLLGVSPQHVQAVAHRKNYSSRIARALSVAIGKPFAEVFDDQPQYHRVAKSGADRAKHLQATRLKLAAAGYDIKPQTVSR